MSGREQRIWLAENVDAVRRCYPVMHQLRLHLDEPTFVAQVERQRQSGYRLAALESDGQVRAVTGYRVQEYLAWGKILYVDDLVTHEAGRGEGWGSALFDWLVEQARAAQCDQFHLDSGVQRFGAHRFYLHKGMDITSHHFAFNLK